MVRKILYALALLVAFKLSLFAGGNVFNSENQGEIKLGETKRKLYDYARQDELARQSSWQDFVSVNPDWTAQFNEANGLPHRAFGKPIKVQNTSTSDWENFGKTFFSDNLKEFNIPVSDLKIQTAVRSPKNGVEYLIFTQSYQGLEVIQSRVDLRLNQNNEVMLFGLDLYNDINLNTITGFDKTSAGNFALGGLIGIVKNISVNDNLKILPVPKENFYEYHLVYEVLVDMKYPLGKFMTFVDAHDGKVLWRYDKIRYDVNGHVQGDVKYKKVLSPSILNRFSNIIVQSTDTLYTNSNGNFVVPGTGNISGTFRLEGKYARIYNDSANSYYSFNTNFNDGDTVTWDDSNSDLAARNGFYHVNVIHDFVKSLDSSVIALDYSMFVNVNVAGSCNAFWDGSGVSFYAAGSGCLNFAEIPDVIYHENGHGMNDRFYMQLGSSFGGMRSGSLHEGMADVMAMCIMDDPILAQGYNGFSSSYIRRYDINKKVYPDDVVGEVHADGEIIAGCFWDTRLNLGLARMQQLQHYMRYGLPDGSDSDLGQVYLDVLIETLIADDGDGDLSNGTPNSTLIQDAFRIHGITLELSVTLTHFEISSSIKNADIPVIVNKYSPYSWLITGPLELHYAIGTSSVYTTLTMVPTINYEYKADIPGQNAGTVVKYYITLKDMSGNVTQIIPNGVLSNPSNIPYFIGVGYYRAIYVDFEGNLSDWTVNPDGGDNATTGIWTFGDPRGTYWFPGDPYIQPEYDHTVSGIKCAVTGNQNTNDPTIDNVDNGKTTLLSPVYDMSQMWDPAIRYYRWFSNDRGWNPKNDTLVVQITNDGVNWATVENTKAPDGSWRHFLFRVSDYVAPTSFVQVRLIAADYANGGDSFVEEAIDDFEILDTNPASGIGDESQQKDFSLLISPNPFATSATLVIAIPTASREKQSHPFTFVMYDLLGRETKQITINQSRITIGRGNLPSGMYFYQLKNGNEILTKGKLVIQ